jgi:predicted transcriptional regulator
MEEFDPVKFARAEDFEDDVPYEERLEVGFRIQRGIEDFEAGRVYTEEQVRERLAQWTTKYATQARR